MHLLCKERWACKWHNQIFKWEVKRNIKHLLILVNVPFLRCLSDFPVVCDSASALRSSLINKVNTSPLLALPLSPEHPPLEECPENIHWKKWKWRCFSLYRSYAQNQSCGFGEHISRLSHLFLVAWKVQHFHPSLAHLHEVLVRVPIVCSRYWHDGVTSLIPLTPFTLWGGSSSIFLFCWNEEIRWYWLNPSIPSPRHFPNLGDIWCSLEQISELTLK